VLTIKSGFPAQANAPNPLGSSAFMLMRNPVSAVLAKSGTPVPAHVSGQEAIRSACEANKPECAKYLTAVTNDAAAGARADGRGGAVLPGVQPGTYYLTTSAKMGQLVLYWHVKLDLKAGANVITLDTHNAEPVK
jgi:imidazolonepropionase-like amidohydrolase